MKVAVVGSGVSGLAATWALNEFSDHEVHLYESDTRLGGHAHTVSFKEPGKKGAPAVDIDTGFIVFNPSTYPNFLRFLSRYPALRAAIQPTDMTFAVSRDGGAFEWAGASLAALFCQARRLADPRMWRMLYDILRFNACARRVLLERGGDEVSIGEYLRREGYSEAFSDNFLMPMTAAVWSTPPDKCALDFPARTLIQFMLNHHLMQLTGRPSWLTLRGGSRVYVDHIAASLPASRVHLNSAAVAVTSQPTSTPLGHEVRLQTADGTVEIFDRVILACHADTALQLLRAGGRGGGLAEAEERVLGAFKYNRNEAVLHGDTRLMPKRRIAWSCWNFLTFSEVDAQTGKKKANVNQVALTYRMNELQHLSEATYGPILVTLNPPFEPEPEKVVGRYQYDHPIIDAQVVAAQRLMPTIQNTRGISYAGAWLKYGFHEDGFTAGLRAALGLQQDAPGSVQLPFEVEEVDLAPQPQLAAYLFDVFEGTGARWVVGFVLSLFLNVLSAFW